MRAAMGWRTNICVVVGGLLGLTCVTGALAQQGEAGLPEPATDRSSVPSDGGPDEEYRRLVELGLAAFNSGRWGEAHGHFDRAHALSPGAPTFRARGVASYRLGRMREALDDLEAALADARQPLSPELRAAVLQLIARVLASVGRVRVRNDQALELSFELDASAAKPTGDGYLVLSPGRHTLRVSALGHLPSEQTLEVSAGTVIELAVHLRREPLSAPVPLSVPGPSRLQQTVAPRVQPTAEEGYATAALVSGGAAVVLGLAGAGLWLAGRQKVHDLADTCRMQRCTVAERADLIEGSNLAALEVLTNTALILAVGCGAAGVLLYAWDEPSAGPQLALKLGAAGGVLGLEARY